jgi:hypothetical protein
MGMLAYRYNDVIADGRADAIGAVLAVAWRMAGGGFEPFQGAISRAAFLPLRMIATIAIDDIFCDYMPLGAIQSYTDNSLPKPWAVG